MLNPTAGDHKGSIFSRISQNWDDSKAADKRINGEKLFPRQGAEGIQDLWILKRTHIKHKKTNIPCWR